MIGERLRTQQLRVVAVSGVGLLDELPRRVVERAFAARPHLAHVTRVGAAAAEHPVVGGEHPPLAQHLRLQRIEPHALPDHRRGELRRFALGAASGQRGVHARQHRACAGRIQPRNARADHAGQQARVARQVRPAHAAAGLHRGVVPDRLHDLVGLGEGAGLADRLANQQRKPARVLLGPGDADPAHLAKNTGGLGWIKTERARQPDTARELARDLPGCGRAGQVGELGELHPQLAGLVKRDAQGVRAAVNGRLQGLELDTDVA